MSPTLSLPHGGLYKNEEIVGAHACIIREKDGQTYFLAAKRADGNGWEFAPGGGIEQGESPDQAIYREIQEEFGPNECSLITQAPVYLTDRNTWTMLYMFEADGHFAEKIDLGNQPLGEEVFTAHFQLFGDWMVEANPENSVSCELRPIQVQAFAPVITIMLNSWRIYG